LSTTGLESGRRKNGKKEQIKEVMTDKRIPAVDPKGWTT
jgi:hypothetical protein